jgi:hypothetical protein
MNQPTKITIFQLKHKATDNPAPLSTLSTDLILFVQLHGDLLSSFIPRKYELQIDDNQ